MKKEVEEKLGKEALKSQKLDKEKIKDQHYEPDFTKKFEEQCEISTEK